MRAWRAVGLVAGVVLAHLAVLQAAPAGRPPGADAARAAPGRAVRVMRLAPVAAVAPVSPVSPAAPAGAVQAPRAGPPLVAAGSGRRPAPRLAPSPPTAASPPAPAAASAPPAPEADPPWPEYPTQPPPALALAYRLDGRDGAQARLTWAPLGDTYTLDLLAPADGRPERRWRSRGRLDAHGVAPERFEQVDNGRVTRAVSVDRVAGEVRYSAASRTQALAPGTQDRWSWLVQLAALAEAQPTPPAQGWTLPVAGLRGELEAWRFEPRPDPGGTAGEPAPAPEPAPAEHGLYLVRAPTHPFDLRIEVWLAPSLHHLPSHVRLSAPPGRWTFELQGAHIVAAPDGP